MQCLSQGLPGKAALMLAPPIMQHVRVLVWDIPVRVTHWAIVLLVVASWVTQEYDLMYWHRLAGYTLLVLVLFRISWGFIGSTTARFSNFLHGPRSVAAYLRSFFSRDKGVEIGHNPLGGWNVIALLGLLLVQCVLGLFSVDAFGMESGPLASHVTFTTGRQIAGWHHVVFNILLLFISLHAVAVFGYFLIRRENLVWPMISGRKRLAEQPARSIAMGGKWRALLAIFTSLLVVILLTNAL